MLAAAIVPSAMLLIAAIAFLSNQICRDFRFWAMAFFTTNGLSAYTNISDAISFGSSATTR